MIDLADPYVIKNPYPFYARLRKEAPLYRLNEVTTLVTRYDDCVALLNSPYLGRDFIGQTERNYGRLSHEPAFMMIREWLVEQDPPNHTILRKVLTPAFKGVGELKPMIDELVTKRIESLSPTFDFMDDFALPLSVEVTCKWMGIPDSFPKPDLNWITTGKMLSYGTPNRLEMDMINRRFIKLRKYLREAVLICPQHTVGYNLCVSLGIEKATDMLLMFMQSSRLISNSLGNNIYNLLRNHDQLELLQEEPELMPDAISELLRFDPAMQVGGRIALQDFTFQGREIRKGERLAAILGSANRDIPNGNQLDIKRSSFKTLTFGAGIHFCLGAMFSRTINECAFLQLIKLPLSINNHEWFPIYGSRGFKKLSVTWS